MKNIIISIIKSLLIASLVISPIFVSAEDGDLSGSSSNAGSASGLEGGSSSVANDTSVSAASGDLSGSATNVSAAGQAASESAGLEGSSTSVADNTSASAASGDLTGSATNVGDTPVTSAGSDLSGSATSVADNNPAPAAPSNPSNGNGSVGGNGPIIQNFGGFGGAVNPNGFSGYNYGPSCTDISGHFKVGVTSDSSETSKLQTFLKDVEGLNVDVTGVYDQKTSDAVKAFQAKYTSDILAPWGSTEPSGFAYITTMKKVNEIRCRVSKNFTADEIAIIRAYKDSLTAPAPVSNEAVIPVATTTIPVSTTTIPTEIGQNTTDTTPAQTANVFSAIGGGIKSFFKGIVNLFR